MRKPYGVSLRLHPSVPIPTRSASPRTGEGHHLEVTRAGSHMAWMTGYYEDRLSGSSLVRCYEIAPPRIRQYLEAEIRFVVGRVRGAARVLELGCGYGRVLKRLSFVVATVAGCDISRLSLGLARSHVAPRRNYMLVRMDAVAMGFRPGAFDAVICIQNGISAFAVDPQQLV